MTILKIIILLALMAAAVAYPTEEEFQKQFKEFKKKYNRTYSTPSDEQYRLNIFKYNYAYIDYYNAANLSYTVAMNEYTDLTHQEFKLARNGIHGMSMLNLQLDGSEVYEPPRNQQLPGHVDWRKKEAVTHIKDQKGCGSCWAMAAVGALEGQHALKRKALITLSEQHLMDCSLPFGNKGCHGGLMDRSYKYLLFSKGIQSESTYPYKAFTNFTCKFKPDQIAANISGFVNIPRYNELALQAAVANIGPIAAGIDASDWTFQFYKGGVYDKAFCSQKHLNHAVTVVGYGTTEKKQDYWLIKNSWGKDWGEGGYMKLARNRWNQCGVATMASYPVV